MINYTLIIPTYNRPVQLRRLLASLERQGYTSKILVADSSCDENYKINVISVGQLNIQVNLIRFNSDMTPFEKFYQASLQIETEYCSMCADDDFLMVDSVEKTIKFLGLNREYAAAHGWYFTFYENIHVGITSIVYKGGYEDHDPLSRLYDMCAKYEAVTYAIYRTEIMRDVLKQARALKSILFKEFSSGILTVLAGKVARLPIIYYGRSLGPSEQYSNWHPLEVMGTRPDTLFSEYLPYRSIVISRLVKIQNIPQERAEALSDLAHLRYLCDYIKPPIIRYLFDCVKLEVRKHKLMQDIWPVLSMADNSKNTCSPWKILSSRVYRNLLPDAVKKVFRRTYYFFRFKDNDNQTFHSVTSSQKSRDYLIYSAFLESLNGTLDSKLCCQQIMESLNTYD